MCFSYLYIIYGLIVIMRLYFISFLLSQLSNVANVELVHEVHIFNRLIKGNLIFSRKKHLEFSCKNIILVIGLFVKVIVLFILVLCLFVINTCVLIS